jgi:putative membrane protein
MSVWQSQEFYLWLKAFHIIAVIAWMAGMLYLPRLFVYHCETAPGTPESERFKIMERKLLRMIINPSMAAVWVLGLGLAFVTRAYTQPWLQAKFVLVLLLSGLHGHYSATVKAFARDANMRSQRYYRIVNEIPAVLLIAIVILAVVKPFS